MTDAPATAATPKQGLGARIGALIADLFAHKPVRVWFHYLESRGPLMASGLSYQAIFAVFATLWLVFSIAGLVIGQNVELKEQIIAAASSAVPGLIDAGNGADGAIDPEALLDAQILGWSGAIALVGLLVAVLNWLGSARLAVRAIFDLPGDTTNLLLLYLKDLGLALVFGVALLVSTALSAISTQLLGAVLDATGIGSDSVFAVVLGRVLGLLVVLALDTTVLAALYRLLSGVTIPVRRLVSGALIGGVGLGILKVAGGVLLGSSRSNPLFDSFAVIIGLLIWFNLACQVVLVCSAWIAIGMTDHGIAADPKAEAARREAERAEREKEQEERAAEIERAATALAAERSARQEERTPEPRRTAAPVQMLLDRVGSTPVRRLLDRVRALPDRLPWRRDSR